MKQNGTKSKRGNPAWTLGYLTAKRKCEKEKQVLIKSMNDFLRQCIRVELHGNRLLLVAREMPLEPNATLLAPLANITPCVVGIFLNEFNHYLEMVQRKTDKL